ncbi:hypothetical protein BGW39_002902 [Mortierella sp. 14UC]|nr:hypothetical protein BGW39_002902 [Mortierella sp. 14UC]
MPNQSFNKTTLGESPTISIPGLGAVKGTLDSTHKVAIFLNVPFGTIQERWRPAGKAQPWSGVRDASKNGPMSPQQTVNHPFISRLLGSPGTNDFDETMSEQDCLHCNIFMPASALAASSNSNLDANSGEQKELLPVMVWIYGGGFTAGTNASPIYDCTNLILTSLELNKPFIAVAINYRVNYLGFLASRELVLDAQEYAKTIPTGQQRHWYDGSVGNWGLLDQILGLEWVQDHISAFAGDRKRVTVMGESAGATSISLLMVIPQAHGLFTRAILQSGAAGCAPLLRIEDEGQAIFDHLCFRFGIGMDVEPLEKVRRLRSVSAKLVAEELNQVGVLFFKPALDGVVFKADSRKLVKDPEALYEGLEWVVAGTCNDEGTVFVPMFGATTLPGFATLKSRLCAPKDYTIFDSIFGIPKTDHDVQVISARLIGNGNFKFPVLQVCETVAQKAGSPCQLTRFRFDTRTATHEQQQQQQQQEGGLGAHHGIDVFFTFGGPVAKAVFPSDKEQAMIRKVQAVWIEVITAPSPQASSLPQISTSATTPFLDHINNSKEAIIFGEDMEVRQGVAERMPKEEIEFWRRSEAFVLEETEKGRGQEVFFDVAKGLLTSAP